MLKKVITSRFSKHHDLCLAYLDTLEEIVQELGCSEQPSLNLENYQRRLQAFFDFMESEQIQHEKEEERILLPVLETHLEKAESAVAELMLRNVSEEHTEGRQMLARLREKWADLLHRRPSEWVEYYDFSVKLIDLVWHLRKHIWAENSLVLPVTNRLLPEESSRIWIHS